MRKQRPRIGDRGSALENHAHVSRLREHAGQYAGGSRAGEGLEVGEDEDCHSFASNPERRGCPGADVLRDLAARSARFEDIEEDQQWKHVIHCAPCYQEYLDSRESCRLGDKARADRESR